MPAPDPVLLVTRPAPAAERFAEAVQARVGPVQSLISPLQEIVHCDPGPLPEAGALVLTSANGAAAADRLGLGGEAWCVGPQTAAAARAAGLEAVAAEGDADSLVALLRARRPAGPLLHLRGAHARGDVARRLTEAGLPCAERVVYRQEPRPPTPQAWALLRGDAPLVVPLFSPRSAALFAALTPIDAPLHLVAISAATAGPLAALASRECRVAPAPEGEAVLALTCDVLGPLLMP
ncbi:hypothetical protein OG2516_11661 [Oceanicola granulosus HTCC2516]|uniref:Tetrapyrrole biosynthesis uroporphyrinogen III synthase domain-containing protein n=1 Tax=Oceanicola granulosus (strain ATCC BAA-861 / DSM 15982 / KCTC 12143 / HTCC2516) TaxID=314256 RepID=Q2CJM1_OCEGH|nr:uroporphyrinogen-III synthase [Oceanicola granulosus]EAR53118.1 hypothetical protein OG2516_11661 [Oceanicola granulosus HTCC2516]